MSSTMREQMEAATCVDKENWLPAAAVLNSKQARTETGNRRRSTGIMKGADGAAAALLSPKPKKKRQKRRKSMMNKRVSFGGAQVRLFQKDQDWTSTATTAVNTVDVGAVPFNDAQTPPRQLLKAPDMVHDVQEDEMLMSPTQKMAPHRDVVDQAQKLNTLIPPVEMKSLMDLLDQDDEDDMNESSMTMNLTMGHGAILSAKNMKDLVNPRFEGVPPRPLSFQDLLDQDDEDDYSVGKETAHPEPVHAPEQEEQTMEMTTNYSSITSANAEQEEQTMEMTKNYSSITTVKAEPEEQAIEMTKNHSCITNANAEREEQTMEMTKNHSSITSVKAESEEETMEMTKNYSSITTFKSEPEVQSMEVTKSCSSFTIVKAESEEESMEMTKNHSSITNVEAESEEQTMEMTKNYSSITSVKAESDEQTMEMTKNHSSITSVEAESEVQTMEMTKNHSGITSVEAESEEQTMELTENNSSITSVEAESEEQTMEMTKNNSSITSVEAESEEKTMEMTKNHSSITSVKAESEEQTMEMTKNHSSITTLKAEPDVQSMEVTKSYSSITCVKAEPEEQTMEMTVNYSNITSVKTEPEEHTMEMTQEKLQVEGPSAEVTIDKNVVPTSQQDVELEHTLVGMPVSNDTIPKAQQQRKCLSVEMTVDIVGQNDTEVPPVDVALISSTVRDDGDPSMEITLNHSTIEENQQQVTPEEMSSKEHSESGEEAAEDREHDRILEEDEGEEEANEPMVEMPGELTRNLASQLERILTGEAVDRTVDLPRLDGMNTADLAMLRRVEGIVHTQDSDLDDKPLPSVPREGSETELELDNVDEFLKSVSAVSTERASSPPASSSVSSMVPHTFDEFINLMGIRFLDAVSSGRKTASFGFGNVCEGPLSDTQRLLLACVGRHQLAEFLQGGEQLADVIEKMKSSVVEMQSWCDTQSPSVFSRVDSGAALAPLQASVKALKHACKLSARVKWHQWRAAFTRGTIEVVQQHLQLLSTDLETLEVQQVQLDASTLRHQRYTEPSLINLRDGVDEQAQVIKALNGQVVELKNAHASSTQTLSEVTGEVETLEAKLKAAQRDFRIAAEAEAEAEHAGVCYGVLRSCVQWTELLRGDNHSLRIRFGAAYEVSVSRTSEVQLRVEPCEMAAWRKAVLSRSHVDAVLQACRPGTSVRPLLDEVALCLGRIASVESQVRRAESLVVASYLVEPTSGEPLLELQAGNSRNGRTLFVRVQVGDASRGSIKVTRPDMQKHLAGFDGVYRLCSAMRDHVLSDD